MSHRNCSEFEALLEQPLGWRSFSDPRWQAHAAVCPRCGPLWNDVLLLQEAVAAWNAEVPAVDLRGAVVTAWQRERACGTADGGDPPRPAAAGADLRLPPLTTRDRQTAGNDARSRPVARRAVLPTVAAVVLLLALALWTNAPRRPKPPAPSESAQQTAARHTRIAASRPNSRPPRPPVTETPPLDGMLRELQLQYAVLKQSVSQLVAEVKPAVPRVRLDVLGNSSRQPMTSPGKGVRKTVGWQTSLEPIPREIRKAFGFLKEAVPLQSPPST